VSRLPDKTSVGVPDIGSKYLIDRERVTPANLDDLYGGTTCKASRIAADSKGDKAPVGSIAACQDLTCNWDSGESAGGKSMSVTDTQVTSQGGKKHSPEAHYGIGSCVIPAIVFGFAELADTDWRQADIAAA
jgi:hypothetical protein